MAYVTNAVRKSRKRALGQKAAVPPGANLGTLQGSGMINSMNLDEMLEASKLIEMGKKGERIQIVKSTRAQRYAAEVLRLNRQSNTKIAAEKMIHKLNRQIIKVNRKTSDAKESKRLYRELMAEK